MQCPNVTPAPSMRSACLVYLLDKDTHTDTHRYTHTVTATAEQYVYLLLMDSFPVHTSARINPRRTVWRLTHCNARFVAQRMCPKKMNHFDKSLAHSSNAAIEAFYRWFLKLVLAAILSRTLSKQTCLTGTTIGLTIQSDLLASLQVNRNRNRNRNRYLSPHSCISHELQLSAPIMQIA